MSGIGYNDSYPEPVLRAFAVLKAGAESGRLAHGYVISCTRMEWGLALGELLLQWLYCRELVRPCGRCRTCEQIRSRSHADVIWIEPESKSRLITVDQIRDLNHAMHQTSFEGGWKAGVMLHAHRLNESSANAFLKTLEEPPDQCLFLLITDNPQAFLPTIRSRCQLIHVGESETGGQASAIEKAMLDWLRRREGGGKAIEQAGWIAGILEEVRGRAEKEEKKRAGEEVDDDVLKARIQSRVIEARLEVLRVLYRWERDLLVCGYDVDAAGLHYPAEREALRRQGNGLSLADKMNRIARIEQAARLLEGNVPEHAVWEAILPA